jgi:hypothetical protein
VVVVVCILGGPLDFFVRLVEKFLCMSSVAAHIPLVCRLRITDPLVGLIDQVLRRHQIRVPAPNVFAGLASRNQHPSCQQACAKNGTQYKFVHFHGENLRSHNTDSDTNPAIKKYEFWAIKRTKRTDKALEELNKGEPKITSETTYSL